MRKIFYHLTDKENTSQILEQGLLPQIGKRALSVGEQKPLIYLSNTKDRAKWQAVLGTDACLRLELPDSFAEEYIHAQKHYSLYQEFTCKEPIPKEHIRLVKNPVPTTRDMRELSEGYLKDISFLCVKVIRMCDEETAYPGAIDGETWYILASDIQNILDICSRIYFRYLEGWRIHWILKSLGDSGEYTLADTYEDTKARLYEMLSEYPSLPAGQERLELKQFIKNTFKSCVNTNTGSYQNPYKEREETES